jgi:hypothetical protein
MTSTFVRLTSQCLRASVVAAAMTAVLTTTSSPLDAQGPVRTEQPTAPGWVFTPGIAVGETWDTNVLLATEDSGGQGDFLTAVSPRGALSYRGRHTTFSAGYSGSFNLYQELTELNAFDQRGTVDLRQRLSPRFTVFARNGLSKTPTTDDVDLPGIVFRRQGVLMDDLRTGVEARFDRRTSLSASYTFQWVDFEQLATNDDLPQEGGRSHGVIADLDHILTPRVSLGGEFDLRRATQNDGRQFNVQNALATIDLRLNQSLSLSGGAGYAWLATDESGEGRSAPAFRVSLSGAAPRFGWNVGYRRSYLPSFGFGGTFQNEELLGGIVAPLGRRLSLVGTLAFSNNQPLTEEGLPLRSVWARSTLSYLATPWMRVEAFYGQAWQDAQRPGGRVDRARFGVQVVTSKRMRIR